MRPAFANTLLVLAASGVALLIGECALRIAGLPRFEAPRGFAFSEGLDFDSSSVVPGYEMHRIKPGSTYLNIYASNPRGYFPQDNTIVIASNRLGFRAQRPSDELPQGDVNIAFLGDSFTLGEGVRFEDTFAEQTARMLEDRLRDRKLSVRAWNFGMLAYNTTQEYSLLVSEVLPRRPDIVVLGYVLNDPESAYFRIDPATGQLQVGDAGMFWVETARPAQSLVYTSRVAMLVWKLLHRLRTTGQLVHYYNWLFSEDNPDWARNRQSLLEIVRVCREHDTPLFVVCLPILYRLERGYPFRNLHQRLKQLVAEAGEDVTFVDALPVLENRSAESLWVHPSDQHPNEIAHRLIASALCERLLPQVERARRAASPQP